ncbi:alpha-ketoglutarate-dependent dioxygenase AlkB family protein [Luteolibacter sp. AS25]|uniref:alpha-ketoglutarate-dependent dioxygenase AlkB family protein n=1 Tax=Luteolibacter sp. AS25 TaxID=3135776 RepID=UPI00398B790D
MDLFSAEPVENLLPYDGVVNYHGVILENEESTEVFDDLMSKIPWENDETSMFGKRIVMARKVAWFADRGRSYTYSGTTKAAHEWTPRLRLLKERCEVLTGSSFNSCLMNLYHMGGEGMGWHSDNEKSIVAGSSIASLSFGAERKFSFKHKKTKETVSLVLETGSLLEMKGKTQECWLHQLPKTKKVSAPRINLTFRQMLDI